MYAEEEVWVRRGGGVGMDVGFFDSLIVKAGGGDAKQGGFRLTYSCPGFNEAHALTHKLN